MARLVLEFQEAFADRIFLDPVYTGEDAASYATKVARQTSEFASGRQPTKVVIGTGLDRITVSAIFQLPENPEISAIPMSQGKARRRVKSELGELMCRIPHG